MQLLSILRMASGASLWRGLDYVEQGRVKNLRPGGEGVFDAEVDGTANLPYTVHVDTVHVRQSHCDCPHAAGTKRICKHMVATVFTAYPQQVDAFKWEVEQEELAFQREEEAHRAELVRYVNSLKKDELREALLAALPAHDYPRARSRATLPLELPVCAKLADQTFRRTFRASEHLRKVGNSSLRIACIVLPPPITAKMAVIGGGKAVTGTCRSIRS